MKRDWKFVKVCECGELFHATFMGKATCEFCRHTTEKVSTDGDPFAGEMRALEKLRPDLLPYVLNGTVAPGFEAKPPPLWWYKGPDGKWQKEPKRTAKPMDWWREPLWEAYLKLKLEPVNRYLRDHKPEHTE